MLTTLALVLLLLQQTSSDPPGAAPDSRAVTPNPDVPAVLASAVNYWKMEESGTDDRVDSVGTDDLTPSEAITTIAGKNGNAANFDLNTHTMVSTAWRATGWTGMTLSAWINRDALPAATAWFHNENTNSNPAFAGYVWTTGRSTFFVRNASGIQAATTPGDIGGLPDWVHYCGSWNADDNVRLFIDGVELGTSGGTLSGPIRDNDVGIFFGRTAVTGINPWASEPGEGYLDEVAIWDTGIGLAGCGAIYDAGEGKFWP